MARIKKARSKGDSKAQRDAEKRILGALRKKIGKKLSDKPDIDSTVSLDGFENGRKPICVEAWAHQGPAKSAQKDKVMKDMCKLLLVEKLLGKPCRKIVVVCDTAALRFLKESWQGRFADRFEIEQIVVKVNAAVRRRVRQAQKRQYR